MTDKFCADCAWYRFEEGGLFHRRYRCARLDEVTNVIDPVHGPREKIYTSDRYCRIERTSDAPEACGREGRFFKLRPFWQRWWDQIVICVGFAIAGIIFFLMQLTSGHP